ncbi:MAG: hypothetical protein Q7T57_06300 [Dehalococcoidales bacterium]|nr:hypothetical protein [Dehalococcoidales bacterium]
MSKKPLYPHVPKGIQKEIQKLKVTAFASETERIATERTITREEEEAIRVAQNVIREIHQLKPQLDKLYDKVKYSMSGWEGPRSIAADLTNAAGKLEYELTEKIRAFRLKR